MVGYVSLCLLQQDRKDTCAGVAQPLVTFQLLHSSHENDERHGKGMAGVTTKGHLSINLAFTEAFVVCLPMPPARISCQL